MKLKIFLAVVAASLICSGYAVLPPIEMSGTSMKTDCVEEIDIPHYKVNNVVLSVDMQDFIYRTCCNMGIEYYFPYFLCQIYQESKFDPRAVSKDGIDYGYCQLRIYYHDDFKNQVGHPEWDLINDPFANIYVGCHLMATNLTATDGNISEALKLYFNSGSDYWNSIYVGDVMQWTGVLERIK